MNAPAHRCRPAGSRVVAAIVAGLLLGLVAGAPARADDTELFVATAGPAQAATRPNVLFIVDTSGSMAAEVLTQAEWDPSVAWEGCFRGDGIYFSTTSTPPSCDSNDWFEAAQNFCRDAWGPLDGVGAYSGRIKAWRAERERWVDLNGDQKGRPVECENDAGSHGRGDDDRPWAANGPAGPWDDGPGLQPAWNQQYYLWSGNWLNWNSGAGTVTRERGEIVRTVVNNLLDNLDGVNVGLMRFHFEEGGPVLKAVTDLATGRDALKAAVDTLPASGWTPLSGTLFEAGQYFAGRNVIYGDFEEPRSEAASRLGSSLTAKTYASPVDAACQKNYVVLLTDGAPTRDTSAQARIEALPGFASLVGPACDGSGDGACLDDLAEYLHKYDLDAALPGLQNVTTYTVGFAVDLPLLEATAQRGGGRYLLADDTSSLASALNEVFLSILDDAATFAAPSVAVNAFNRTQHRNEVYLSLFQPSGTMHWPGNLKKYVLSAGRLVGQDGRPAVDPDTGFFREDAFSFWSPARDGNRVPEGGAASRLPGPDTRRLFTDIAGGPLAAAGNAITVGNPALTAAMIGAPAEDRDRVIQWFRGLDVLDDDDDGATTDTRGQLGDPLHVRPVTVTYGGTPTAPDDVVYVATNDGQLHAIDADSGEELWAYTPSRLLGRIYELFLDEPTATKRYGLDGEIRVHVVNDDGLPGVTGGERVVLVFGMRRGGDSVFALDVTDRRAPVRLWEINANTPGFADLGQTWSTPVVTDVNIGGIRRTVALFGGGYDEGQDNPGFRADTIGNAVFMVDLLTGSRLWSAGDNAVDHQLALPQLRHSIPAPLTVLDLDRDRLADRIYVGDMGGRVWRFDIVNGAGAESLVQGGVLASLGAADLPAPQPPGEVRRFYAAADVVPVVARGQLFLTINLGSGFRAHPLDTTVRDEFFSIRDFRVREVIDSADYPRPLTRGELVNVTNNARATLPPTARGWRLRMIQSPGEKILNPSFTFGNSVFFTSFSPSGTADACIATRGVNRLYQVSVLNGGAVTNLDASIDEPDAPLTESDRFRTLRQGGIAPAVVFLFPPDQSEEPVVCIGVECETAETDNDLVRTFWTEDGA